MTEETTEATGFDPDAISRVRVYNNPDGTMTMTDGTRERTIMSPQIEADIQEVEQSAARKRYLAAKSQKPRIEAVTVGDEKYFVRSLGVPAVTRVHLMASRNGDGALDLAENDDDLRKFYIAILESCTVSGPDDFTPFFTLEEAADWVDSEDPGLHAICDVVFAKALELTPTLTPKKVNGVTIRERATSTLLPTVAPASVATVSTSTTPNSSE